MDANGCRSYHVIAIHIVALALVAIFTNCRKVSETRSEGTSGHHVMIISYRRKKYDRHERSNAEDGHS